MAKHFIQVEEGSHWIYGSCGWSYVADENAIYIGSVNHEYYLYQKGNFIGKEVVVDLEGYYSKFLGEKKIPKNPVFKVLHEHGYFKCHKTYEVPGFFGYFDPDEETWNHYVIRCCYDYEPIYSHDVSRYEIRHNNEVIIALAAGRIDWRDKFFCKYWISPKAKLNTQLAKQIKLLLSNKPCENIKETGNPGWYYHRIMQV